MAIAKMSKDREEMEMKKLKDKKKIPKTENKEQSKWIHIIEEKILSCKEYEEEQK
jgi:hypothetical protein